MTNKISAKFFRRRKHDSGKDQAPDYYVYEFTDIVDSEGKKYPNKWIKESNLMKNVNFKKDKEYTITLSESPNLMDGNNLPFPVEITWDGERLYIKNGNKIMRVDRNGNETNLSVRIK